MGLDKNRKNTGYLLGRLFLALKASSADGEVYTLPDESKLGGSYAKLYGDMQDRPTETMAIMLSAYNRHSYRGLDALINEIISDLPAGPLSKVKPDGQFDLGYHHQAHALEPLHA